MVTAVIGTIDILYITLSLGHALVVVTRQSKKVVESMARQTAFISCQRAARPSVRQVQLINPFHPVPAWSRCRRFMRVPNHWSRWGEPSHWNLNTPKVGRPIGRSLAFNPRRGVMMDDTIQKYFWKEHVLSDDMYVCRESCKSMNAKILIMFALM